MQNKECWMLKEKLKSESSTKKISLYFLSMHGTSEKSFFNIEILKKEKKMHYMYYVHKSNC